MSIIIRKKETGEVFDIVSDFKLEVRNTSPLFNDLGSKSITTTLPKTPHNVKLFGFSNRLDILNKPLLKIPVIISSGSYVRNGMLYESSAYNTDNTFGITIAFDEGIMYESMSDILLTELSNLPVKESTVNGLYEDMNNLFTTDDPDKHLSVFYVQFKKQAYKLTEETDEKEKYWYEYVNGVMMEGVGVAGLSKREITYAVEENKLIEIEVPANYGITPFVRVWYLLDLVFAHYGYTVGKNPFKEDFQLKRLCILNNTIDAIVTGTLDYKQLLPPVSVSDFLNALYCRFGLKVLFDSNTNTVNMVLIKDILSKPETALLALSSYIDIDYTAPKQIKLSVAKSLDESDTELETYEEFLSKYNNTIGILDSNSTVNKVKVGGIYYDSLAGQFYQCSTINNEKKRLSSIHFDWNKKNEGIEIEDISSKDEALTMLHNNDAYNAYLYFGLSPQLINCDLHINGMDKESNTQNVLAFAFDMGVAYYNKDSIKDYLGYTYGSIFPYTYQTSDTLQEDKEGNRFKYALTLTGEYGAFKQFFKEYDAFLRHSNHTVKMESYQNVYDLSAINLSNKYSVNNQPILLDKVDYDLDGSRGQLSTIEARTLRLYEPYDLNKEQSLPQPDDIKYQWVLCANQESQIKNKKVEVSKQIPKESVGVIAGVTLSDGTIIEDLDPVGDRTYWFLPPSEYQYQNKRRTGSRTHTCKVRYTCKYLSNKGTVDNPRWETVTQDYKEDVTYESWFEAEAL